MKIGVIGVGAIGSVLCKFIENLGVKNETY